MNENTNNWIKEMEWKWKTSVPNHKYSTEVNKNINLKKTSKQEIEKRLLCVEM